MTIIVCPLTPGPHQASISNFNHRRNWLCMWFFCTIAAQQTLPKKSLRFRKERARLGIFAYLEQSTGTGEE
jgi:hypothetical protein